MKLYKTTPEQSTEPGVQEQPESPLVTGGTGSTGFPRGLQGTASTSPSQRMLEDTGGERINHSTHNTRGQRRKPRGCGGPKTQGKNLAGAVPMRGHEKLGCCVPLHSGPWDAATACPHERNRTHGMQCPCPKGAAGGHRSKGGTQRAPMNRGQPGS